MAAETPPHGRIFHGWYVAYALCVVSTVTSGLVFYNIGVLLDAFVVERGFPIGLASSATGLFFVASGTAGVVAGYLMERVDARLVIIVSACVSAAALGCIGSITTLWQLYAFFLVFGFCYGGCGLVPISTIVARWFTVRRPQALAVASTGLSLGGIVATPVSALLVKQLGLAGAAPWLALAFFLGVVPVTAFIVRARPQAIGLEPDGARRTSVGAPAGLPGTSFAAAWRTRYFVAVTGAYMFVLGSQVGGIAHIFRLANLRVDTHVAAVALALFAAASLGGRLVSGWLLGRVPLRAFALALMASQSVALAFLAFATTKIAVLAGTALFGLTAGTILMMQQLLIADAFGARDYGRIYSVSSLLTVLGVASGPSLVGLVSETAGGYVASYAAIALASLAGLIVMTLAGPPRRA